MTQQQLQAGGHKYAFPCLPWLFLLLTMGPLAGSMNAQFTFFLNNNKAEITGYTGSATIFSIPSSINGYPVVSIGDSAFHDRSTFLSVSLPNSVTNIGAGAFFQCYALTNVSLGTNVTVIGPMAFDSCSSLTNVVLPPTVQSIGSLAFFGTRISTITIPQTVTNLGLGAFTGCTALQSIEVSSGNSSYFSLDGVLFNNDQTILLQYPGAKPGPYTIPASVTNVEAASLFGCAGLTSLTIGESVNTIKAGSMAACHNLTSILVENGNSSFSSSDGVLFNKTGSILTQCPAGKSGSYQIPSGVTSLAASAFKYCRKLSSVTVPTTVTTIGVSAFEGCSQLAGVYFGGNAPVAGAAFGQSDKCIIYYLPGRTGWTSIYDGRPTSPWNPQIRNAAITSGSASGFEFGITGPSNLVVVLECSTNLSSSQWTALQTNTLTGPELRFTDAEWTNSGRKFYRLRSP